MAKSNSTRNVFHNEDAFLEALNKPSKKVHPKKVMLFLLVMATLALALNII